VANEVRKVLGIEPGEGLQPFAKVIPISKPETSKTQPYAAALWLAADADDGYVADHPYCTRKGIKWACGAARGRASGRLIGKDADCVIVPQRTLKGAFIGLECINSDGVKQTFGKKGVFTLGNTMNKVLPLYIVEGWADGVATWRYFGNVVVIVAFGIGRQDKLAEALHKTRPEREIIIVRDAA
jgi:putative DNA primase/helicase